MCSRGRGTTSGDAGQTPPDRAVRSQSRVVTSSDGTRIAVYEHGRHVAEAPTVILAHGYPDSATLWDGVVKELAPRYHVVTYYTRGSGDSDHPEAADDYQLELLAEDFAAVRDAVATGKPVHLFGHDSGSAAAGSIASCSCAMRIGLAPSNSWARFTPR